MNDSNGNQEEGGDGDGEEEGEVEGGGEGDGEGGLVETSSCSDEPTKARFHPIVGDRVGR